ncbi:MAG TPA: class I SAM-dependent methyltransferase [Solirubrobacteraceae bacterium]|nr:class I SAM-dependent methyltransferase [Solirubrobacteraceae bacterium]
MADDWYVGFHRGLAARFWRAAGASMAEADTTLIRHLLDLPAGASVLDVPCGDGRISLRLAAAGYVVTGVDIAAEEIDVARAAATEAGVQARFEVGDLRDLPDVGPVDAVLSWGNSFGYLVPEQTARSLAGMRRALRPGGRLVLETYGVAESVLVGGLRTSGEHEFAGLRMSSTMRYRAEESRMESEYVFEDADGNVERSSAAHHVHTSGEIVRMLRAAGFAEVRLLGADGTEPYEPGSRRLIVLAACA